MHPIPRSFAFLLLLAALLFTLPLTVSAKELIDVGSGSGGSNISQAEDGDPSPTDPSEPPTEPPTSPSTQPAVEAKYRISIIAPKGWYTKTADVIIGLEDIADTGFTLAEVKAGQDGKWIDVTDDLDDDGKAKYEIFDNVTVYVAITDHTGKAHVKSLYVECFDRDAPTVKASVDGKSLRAEAEDALSGVAAIFVSGYEFDDLRDGALDIRVREYVDSEEKEIFVYAVDEAGNRSKTVTTKNPYYEEENGNRGQNSAPTAPTAPAPTAPPATQPTAPTLTAPATPAATNPTEDPTEPAEPKPFTPDGTGSVVDSASEQDGKDFFTITTADENTFYLVVDHQRDSDGVYLLDSVTENDLLSLAERDPEPPATAPTVPATEPETVPVTEPETELETEPETEAETEPELAKPESNTGGIIFIILAALVFGGVAYYFKILKPRKDAELSADEEDDEGEDLDDDGVYGDDPDERDDDRFGADDEQNGGGGA